MSDDKGRSGTEALFGDEEEATLAGGWWQPGKSGDRRKHPRFTFVARLTLIPANGEVMACETRDLSVGGVLLQTKDREPLPIDQFVDVTLLGNAVQLTLSAIVARHAEDGAFAVRFIDVEAEQRELLSEIVDEAERSMSDEFEVAQGSYSLKKT